MYIGHGFIITFERYLLAIEPQSPPAGTSPSDNPLLVNSVYSSMVLGGILDDADKISKESIKCLGAWHLMHEIAVRTVSSQELLLEFFSRTLTVLSKKMSSLMRYGEKLQVHHTMHVVLTAVKRMRRYNELMSGAMNNLSAPVSSVRRLIYSDNEGSLGNGVLSELHVPTLLDVLDVCAFVEQCLDSLAKEADSIHVSMETFSVLRSNHISTILSLTATVFWPLTFLTGLFGTNFSVGAGYTIGMLNEQYGPHVFGVMCIVSALLTIIYFAWQGWLTLPVFARFYKHRDAQPSSSSSSAAYQR